MKLSAWLALLTAFPIVSACATAPYDEVSGQIDSYIKGLPYLPTAVPQVNQGATSAASRDGDYSCTTQSMSETRQFDRVIAYAANSDSLWPGAIVSADSVVSGLFTQVTLPRAPETISVSLENLEGSKRATVAAPSLSAYRDALAGILDTNITGSTPANIYSEIEQVHSSEQLDMALGIQASWGLGIASLKTAFDFSNQQIRSRYVVRYTQAYYTVDVDAPEAPSKVFAPETTLADVSAKLDETHPPAFVSSVTYGRLVVFTFESAYSATEMGAALDFAYSGGADVKGDVSVTYKDILSKSKITAFILGGDAGTAVKSIDSYDNLIAFIKGGGNYSKTSPGAPIAYKLSYLKDNSPARMSFTTDYDVKDCVRVAQRVKVTLTSIAVDSAGSDSGSDLELFGTVSAQAQNGATLFARDENHYVQVHEGQSIGTSAAPLGEAVMTVQPSAGHSINLRAALKDHDPFFTDDIGDQTISLPFETGWRRSATVLLTGGGMKVRAIFDLAPI